MVIADAACTPAAVNVSVAGPAAFITTEIGNAAEAPGANDATGAGRLAGSTYADPALLEVTIGCTCVSATCPVFLIVSVTTAVVPANGAAGQFDSEVSSDA